MNNPSPLARKTYAGFFWQTLGFSLTTILSLSHMVIMARLLSPEIFGQFAIVGIILGISAIVSTFGLGPALVQKNNISNEDTTFVFAFNITAGIALYLVLFVFSNNISAAFDNAISPLMVKVLAFNLLVEPIGLASKSLLIRRMDFHKIFVGTNLSYFIGMLLIGVSLALLGYGIWSLILGFVATSAVASVYYLTVSRFSFSFKFDRSNTKYLLNYGIGQTAVEGVNQSSMMADKIIFSQLASNNFLGLYERSQRIQQMPTLFIGGILDTVLFSTFSKFSDDKPALGRHFFNIVSVTILIGTYLSILLFTCAELVVSIVLGERWLDAVFVLQMLSVLLGFQLLGRLGDSYIRATGAFKKSLKVKISFLTLIIVLAFFGYQVAHLNGALVGIVIATIAHNVLMIMTCQRDCDYPSKMLWERIRPGIIFAALLIVKNWLVFQAFHVSGISGIILLLVTDFVAIALMLSSDYLLGKDNREYILVRLNELVTMLKSRLA